MDASTLDAVFERYCAMRDPRDLGEVFDRTAGELLRVAAHLCKERSEAEDLVQSTFLAVIEGADRYQRGRSVLPWLLGILANQQRMARRRSRRNAPDLTARPDEPADPLELASRRELGGVLRGKLDQLPEIYRSVLVLHLEHDLSAREIARALNRPRGTVRSQLHRGLDLLREALPAGIGAGLLLTTPATATAGLEAVRSAVVIAAAEVSAGVWLGVTMKKVVSIAVILVLATGGVWTFARSGGAAPAAPPSGSVDPVVARVVADAQTPPSTAAPERVAASPRPDSGTVRVRTRFDDLTPAPGVVLMLLPRRADGSSWAHRRLATTGAAGEALVAVAPGELVIRGMRGGAAAATVVAGEEALVELTLPTGLDVLGRVVTADGHPAPSARIAIGPDSDDVREVAVADGDGRFAVRGVGAGRWLAAFARGRLPSSPVRVDAAVDGELTLTLGSPAGVVEGLVLDDLGQPVEGADVFLGHSHHPMNLALAIELDEPLPVPPNRLRTDRDGRFVALGVSTSAATPLWVGAGGYGVARRPVRAREDVPVSVVVRLEPAAALRGTVQLADGTVAGGAVVELRDRHSPARGISPDGPEWAQTAVRCDERGWYSVGLVTPGSIRVRVTSPDRTAVAFGELEAVAGRELEWNPTLRSDLTIAGVVVDRSGQPLPGWRVRAEAPEGAPRSSDVTTDADGGFELEDCVDVDYRIEVRPPGPWSRSVFAQAGVRPAAGVARIVVPDAALPSCSIRGVATDPEGQPLAGVQVAVWTGHEAEAQAKPSGSDGSFELPGLPAEVVDVLAEHPRFGHLVLGRHALRAGAVIDLGTVAFARPGVLEIRLTGLDGEPLAKGMVQVFRDGMRYGHNVDIAAGAGRAELPPGTYTFNYFSKTAVLDYREFEVRGGETVRLELREQRGILQPVRYEAAHVTRGTMFVQIVRDGAGRVLRRGRFRLWQPVALDTDSRFLPGHYSIEMIAPDGRSRVTRFTVGVNAARISIAVP